MYSNDKTCKNEVFHDVEKIRELESNVKYTETNSFRKNEKLTFDATNNEGFAFDIKYSGPDNNFINENFQNVKIQKFLETNNLVLNEYNEDLKIYPKTSTRNTFDENNIIQKNPTIISQQRKFNIFKEKIIAEINLARTNPTYYAEKLEDMIKLIKPNKSEKKIKNRQIYKYVLEYSHKKNIGLSSGEESFRKAIDLLRNMTPLNPLQLEPEIYIDIQKEHLKDIENVIIEKKCNKSE